MKDIGIFSILSTGSNGRVTKISLFFAIFMVSYLALNTSTFAQCTDVTINYWYADWYADAWLTECGNKKETTFYASHDKNTVKIETGTRIRIGQTGTLNNSIDTYPTGPTLAVLCVGRLDGKSEQYGGPTCRILSGETTQKK